MKNKNKLLEQDITNDRFENSLLNWIRSILLLCTAGLAIIGFLKTERAYGILIFGIALFLLAIRLINYWTDRARVRKEGIKIRFRTDVLALSMIPIFVATCWLLYKFLINCKNDKL